MKALLVTIFKVPNYGSVLQAYATQYILEHLGVKCVVLNYDHNNSCWGRMHGVKGISLVSKIATWFGLTPQHRKRKLLDDFINRNFSLTEKYNDVSKFALSQEIMIFDFYIAGSDQIWNTRFTNCDPAFLLQFAPKNSHRISIASSFACEKLEDCYKEIFKKELNRFKAISVREALGQQILSNLGIGNSCVILDPTLLVNFEQWNKLRTKKEGRLLCGKYILLYMLNYAFESRPYIYDVLQYFNKDRKYKIIALEGYDRNDSEQQKLNVIDATASSVTDFLNYFANASMVVTSSFHGTAFAINYGKPLVSIVPDSSDDRQSSLLALMGLSQCQLRIGQKVNIVNPFYNADEEQAKLEKLRKSSLKWIKDALMV